MKPSERRGEANPANNQQACSVAAMARQCWCGCGRQLGRGDHRVAKRARDTHALVTMLREYTLPIYEASGRDPAEFNEFIEAGGRFTAEVLMVAHGELSATEM